MLMLTWSCLSFLARAGRLRAIAMTTAEACGDGRKERSLEMSRLPFLTDMIITHCSSLTLMKRKRKRIERVCESGVLILSYTTNYSYKFYRVQLM